jgi:hypothetical protein
MLISQEERSSGHYIVIEAVGAKFWTNNGKRGYNKNPTKTSTPLPSILVLSDDVIACVYFSMRE